MDSYLTREELLSMNFASLGKDVKVSRNAVIYSPDKIILGDKKMIRTFNKMDKPLLILSIDDFCFISGGVGVCIGNFVHIAAYSAIYGKFGIEIGDYVNVSSRVSIYSTSDDYSGEYLTGPLVNSNYIHDIGKKVVIEKLSIIGTGSTLLPGAILREGVAIGAMSLVKTEIPAYTMYAGVPARFIKDRSKKMLDYLGEFEDEY